jgi:hypothetical protein
VTLIPIGYVGIREAAAILARSMFAGVPDHPVVTSTRELGFEVVDRDATDGAIAELWKAHDRGQIRAVAIGGPQRRIVRLDPDLTKGVPLLRSARGGDFTYMRPGNRLHTQFVAWFGPMLSDVALAFPQTDIEKCARAARRAWRKKASRDEAITSRKGRPSRQAEVIPIIQEIIELKQWNTKSSMKALTTLVNRSGKFTKDVSQDTVARALNALHQKTGGRQFQRPTVGEERPVRKKPRVGTF